MIVLRLFFYKFFLFIDEKCIRNVTLIIYARITLINMLRILNLDINLCISYCKQRTYLNCQNVKITYH